MARTSRKTPQYVREKISAALKRHYAAHPMTEAHKAAIGEGLKAYWVTIPNGDPAAERTEYNVGENSEKK